MQIHEITLKTENINTKSKQQTQHRKITENAIRKKKTSEPKTISTKTAYKNQQSGTKRTEPKTTHTTTGHKNQQSRRATTETKTTHTTTEHKNNKKEPK